MDELGEFISRVRDELNYGNGRSLADILRDLGVSPENEGQFKALLAGLGISDSELHDMDRMARLAEGFLMSMPEETRQHLVHMVLQVIADMNLGDMPAEVKGVLSSFAGDPGIGPTEKNP